MGQKDATRHMTNASTQAIHVRMTAYGVLEQNIAGVK